MCCKRNPNSSVRASHASRSARNLISFALNSKEDGRFFGGAELVHWCKDRLVEDEEGFFLPHYRYRPNPSRHVNIRTTDDETYAVVDTTDGKYRVLEEIEWARAIFELFEGAIFLHQGMSFLVKEISHETRIGKLEKTNVEWTTRQRDFTWVEVCEACVIRADAKRSDIDAIETLRIREIQGAPLPAYYGRIKSKCQTICPRAAVMTSFCSYIDRLWVLQGWPTEQHLGCGRH